MFFKRPTLTQTNRLWFIELQCAAFSIIRLRIIFSNMQTKWGSPCIQFKSIYISTMSHAIYYTQWSWCKSSRCTVVAASAVQLLSFVHATAQKKRVCTCERNIDLQNIFSTSMARRTPCINERIIAKCMYPSAQYGSMVGQDQRKHSDWAHTSWTVRNIHKPLHVHARAQHICLL